MRDKYKVELKVGDIVATCSFGRSGIVRGQIVSFNGHDTRAHIRTEGTLRKWSHSRECDDIIKISDGVVAENIKESVDLQIPAIPV